MRPTGIGPSVESRNEPSHGLLGIIVSDGRLAGVPPKNTQEPRISAFVWGGKVRPSPSLPFGRSQGGA
jgi:hypothetical protein